MKKMLFVFFLPLILIQLLLLNLWTNEILYKFFDVPCLELVFQLIFMPLYLIFVKVRYYKTLSFVKSISLMLVSSFIGNIMGYLNWGLQTKDLFMPDGMTLAIVNSSIIINFIIITIFLLTFYLKTKFIKTRKFY